jgi:hypothetical protein
VSSCHRELAARIRAELKDVERVVERAQTAWGQARRSPDDPAFIEAVALNLHSFYSGLERLFELLARHMDGVTLTGDSWHRDLLHRMAMEIAHLRPAVLSPDSLAALDQFRRFRHLVRKLYTFNLAPEKLADLMPTLLPTWKMVQAELLAFAEFVDALSQASRQPPSTARPNSA